MNFFVYTVLCMAAPLVLCYDEKYDKLDVDKIIATEEMFTGYINCLLDKGPCDIEYSADFRKILPEVIETACAKCNDLQKANVKKSVKALQEKKPDEFMQFKDKYDPNGDHEKKFLEFVFA